MVEGKVLNDKPLHCRLVIKMDNDFFQNHWSYKECLTNSLHYLFFN